MQPSKYRANGEGKPFHDALETEALSLGISEPDLITDNKGGHMCGKRCNTHITRI